jgi:hypothetical protein
MSISQNFPNTRPSLNLNFARSQRLDPRITFTRTTSGTRTNSDGLIEVVPANSPRFDFDPVTGECLGLLIEESRQNFIRNNTMQGAVVGTPGTAPTYWSLGTSGGGLSREIVGVGIEDGISYVDIRWSGTVTTNPIAYWSFNPESDNSLFPGTRTSRYTFSNYIKVVGGTVPTTSNFIMVYYNTDSSFQNLQQYQVLNIPLSNTIGKRLIESRYSFTNNDFTNTNTAYFRPYYQWNFYFNEVIDITLRIGMPQVELGSFATSVIPTSGSTVTRTADNARIEGKNFTDFYNPSEGTILTNVNLPFRILTGARSFALDDGTTAYMMDITNTTNTFTLEALENSSYTNIRSISNSTSKIIKQATSFNSTSQTISINGEVTSPSSTSLSISRYKNLRIGSQVNNVAHLNGYIQQLVYYPTALPSNQLITLTK